MTLWTTTREKLNVVAVILDNRSYAILNVELQRVGAASVGAKAKDQLDLGNPAIDLVQMGLSHAAHRPSALCALAR